MMDGMNYSHGDPTVGHHILRTASWTGQQIWTRKQEEGPSGMGPTYLESEQQNR